MNVPLTPLEFIERAAKYYPDKAAIVTDNRRLTFAEYYERCNQLASALQKIGLEDGQSVVMICPNTHHLLEGFFGINGGGGVFSPINPREQPQFLKQVIEQVSCPVLIFHSAVLEVIDKLRPDLSSVTTYVIIEPEEAVEWATDYEAFLETADPEFRPDIDKVDEDDVASISFGHGAWGGYRGAAFTHRALYLQAMVTLVTGSYFEYDTMFNLIPNTEANGFGIPHAMVAMGITQVILNEMNINLILRTIHEEKVTRMVAVPSLLNAIIRHPYLSDYDISSLKYIVVSGAAYTPELVKEVEEALGCRVEGAYGQIETGPLIATARAKSSLLDDDEARIKAQASAGMPVIGTRIRVVDEDGKDVPWDSTSEGEVITRTNWTLHEYHQRPDLNEEKLVDGWFHTGDLATVDKEGYLRIVGEKSRR